MSSIRTNDLVFVFNGGDPFSKFTPIANDFDLTAYNQKVASLTNKRGLLASSRGVDEDVGANVDTLMKDIRQFARNDLKTIGQVVLLGRSAGCHLALCLAAELNDIGIVDIRYLGLSDVPMWDNGRQPAVRKVGAFKPLNDPTQAGVHTRAGGLLGPAPNDPSDPASNSIPKVKLDQQVKALKKVNLLQIQGNHTKFASSVKRWIWTSGFSGGEVHGDLDGFDNRLRTVTGNSVLDKDLSFHVNLNTGAHWKAMCKEAAVEFADIPSGMQ